MSSNIDFRGFIQIAGVTDLDEARLLIDCGVEYLGFPLRLPVNKEDLSEKEAAKIIRAIRPVACGVVITYQNDAADVASFTEHLGASAVQLHGDIARDELAKLRAVRPDLAVIKSLVVGAQPDEKLVGLVRSLGEFVDAFITDTFDPVTGATGATGMTHDWRVSRRLVELSPKPIILAGGLSPENVKRAILTVKPAGVDAHTGVEGSGGRKDAARVRAFVSAAKAAFARLEADAESSD